MGAFSRITAAKPISYPDLESRRRFLTQRHARLDQARFASAFA